MPTTAATATPELPSDCTAKVAAGIKSAAIPFSTVDPAADLNELSPFGAMVGDASLVGLGEATHGTHEFALMKARLLRYLVEKKGFTVFALEADGALADKIDGYIQTGEGDPRDLLTDLQLWPWRTREVLDLIEWMRTYNQGRGDAPAIHFTGFDMQLPEQAIEDVTAYVERVDPNSLQAMQESLRVFSEGYANVPTTYTEAGEASKSKARQGIQSARELLTGHQAAYEAASSPQEFAIALQDIRVIEQAEALYAVYSIDDFSSSVQLRDKFMAENIGWLREYFGPGTKLVLWAHNGHIQASEWAAAGNQPAISPMGSMLRQAYGLDYLTVGFDFAKGGFNAIYLDSVTKKMGGLGTQLITPPRQGSFEVCFQSLDLPLFILDMRSLSRNEPAGAWLSTPHWMWSIGAAYDRNDADLNSYAMFQALPPAFDVLIYIDTSTPSELLR